jgi:hypothetical protein
MLTIQTGQLMVRGLAPLRSDRLVGYSVHLRSSYQQIPDGFTSAFSATLTTPAIVPEQLAVV